jgi:hypothetical protein
MPDENKIKRKRGRPSSKINLEIAEKLGQLTKKGV